MLQFDWKFFRKKSCLFKCPTFHPAVVTHRHVSPSAHWSRMRGWYCYPLLSHRKIHAPQRLFECYRRGRKMLCCRKHWPLWTMRYRFFIHISKYDAVHCRNMLILHWQLSTWTVWCDAYWLYRLLILFLLHVLLLMMPALQSKSVLISVLKVKIHDSKLVTGYACACICNSS